MVRIEKLATFLDAHFGEVELHFPEQGQETEGEEPSLLIRLDEAFAQVNLATLVCFLEFHAILVYLRD
jgi:cleavage and polyadenylation specificity factor subunit 3